MGQPEQNKRFQALEELSRLDQEMRLYDTPMKATTIIQPWASLIILGHKRIETRPYNTRFRGTLLIHAGKKRNEITEQLTRDWKQFLPDELVLGFILGTIELTDSVPIETLTPTDQERQFGDYRPGRFGWVLTDPRPFETPIPYRGLQGFFNVPSERLPEIPP